MISHWIAAEAAPTDSDQNDTKSIKLGALCVSAVMLARISHQDHGSRRRIRVRKRRSGAKSVAIATV